VAEDTSFYPHRRAGVIFHAGAILILAALAALGFYFASRSSLGLELVISLALILLATVLIPALSYQGYALLRATYTLERDGILLHWGLRAEDIPMGEVLWVHLESELPGALPRPTTRWPGAVLGMRKLPKTFHLPGDSSNAQEIEYLAGRTNGLVIIATRAKFFAISPVEPQKFVDTYQQLVEYGSVAPLAPRSVYPTFLLARAWRNRAARFLWLASILLSLGLFAWVSLAIPTHSEVVLAFDASGQPRELVPSIQLLLLPVLNALLVAMDFFGGLFFYRNEEDRPLAFILWGAGVLTPLLFLIGVYFLLQAS
jgi:hypothetical protein